MTRLAIIIVNFNGRQALEGCLIGLHSNQPRVSHTITVVDNHSTDDSLRLARTRYPASPTVRYIELPENIGFGRANNVGIRETQSELILLLNNDTFTPPGQVDTLVAALDRDPGAAVAGPRLVNTDDTGEEVVELSFGRMMGPLTELRQKVLGHAHEARTPVLATYVDRLLARPGTPDWVSGACLLVRRADAEAVGLLDERFFMYTEDVDFCASIRARGRRILYVPEATIMHSRGTSRASAPAATQAAYRRSHLAFYEKHHPGWAPWLRRYLRLRGQLPTPLQ
jgi:N-acetylglucosaminyl-diphospho-decaprenol L-rhamnosyltransferase